MEQKIQMDLGANVDFGGFALQAGFAEMVKIDPSTVVKKPNDAELYFEVRDIEEFQKKLEGWGEIEYVHPLFEQPWCQRVIRFYDPDKHMIEVGEGMPVVCCRLLGQGLSVKEVSKRTMMPAPFVEQMKAAEAQEK